VIAFKVLFFGALGRFSLAGKLLEFVSAPSVHFVDFYAMQLIVWQIRSEDDHLLLSKVVFTNQHIIYPRLSDKTGRPLAKESEGFPAKFFFQNQLKAKQQKLTGHPSATFFSDGVEKVITYLPITNFPFLGKYICQPIL
jgi:hypothetical protein